MGAKWMLAIPEEVRSCAKLFSAAAAPSGTSSKRIWFPEAPSSNPVSRLSSSAERNSFQAVSNCAIVRTCPNSYRRANFSRMFKLRTNARADCRVSPAISAQFPQQHLLLTLGCLSKGNKHSDVLCRHLTNRSIICDTFLHSCPVGLLLCPTHQYNLCWPVRPERIPRSLPGLHWCLRAR